MKHRTVLLRLTAWILLLSVTVCLCGCNYTDERNLRRIEELEQENAELKAKVASLTAKLEAMRSSILNSWDLNATMGETKEDPVTIWFTAVPAIYLPGQTASLQIMLNGREKANSPCMWDGSSYSAFLTLEPADGYSYYCILTGADGKEERTALSTPENPQKPILTFLESSMNAYCHLTIDEWAAKTTKLKLLSGVGTIQLPLLTDDEEPLSCTKVQLVLQRNGKTLETIDLPITEGETDNSYLAVIHDVSFHLPEMEADDQLDLWMDVFLSRGGGLTVSGGSWYQGEETLELVVG